MNEVPRETLQVVREAGYRAEAIPASPQGADFTRNGFDRMQTEEVARKHGARGVLIDHYGATTDYFQALRGSERKVAVIDDLGDRDFHAVDWLLNQNLGQPAHPYRVRPDCIQLLGPAYALLRPEFALARQFLSRAFTPQDRKVLITLGGGETTFLGCQVVDALNLVSRQLEIRWVLGMSDGLPPRFLRSLNRSRHVIQILRNVNQMAEQMLWADLAINAGGSTCWELSCLGVPMIVLVTSPDQRLNAAALEREECAWNLGEWSDRASGEKLVTAVETLLQDPQRETMSFRARTRVDGQGAIRVAQSLRELSEQPRGGGR